MDALYLGIKRGDLIRTKDKSIIGVVLTRAANGETRQPYPAIVVQQRGHAEARLVPIDQVGEIWRHQIVADLRDVMTIDQALADPQAFVDGMEEIS